ncbi:hypothetical protein [Entomomonas asaccharolytica]|uniref:Uncharacterized protein n=1 Tax=Entomomonas asaccharolytica TaxID=2785331 RepID=A0A974NDY0_9GAMM|nr:hypothetical protein [Entomomonas asaccharolytica]QQP84714.1 hypothetical protein JHT90_09875 [Entomomonas asaccharolytica]
MKKHRVILSLLLTIPLVCLGYQAKSNIFGAYPSYQQVLGQKPRKPSYGYFYLTEYEYNKYKSNIDSYTQKLEKYMINIENDELMAKQRKMEAIQMIREIKKEYKEYEDWYSKNVEKK